MVLKLNGSERFSQRQKEYLLGDPETQKCRTGDTKARVQKTELCLLGPESIRLPILYMEFRFMVRGDKQTEMKAPGRCYTKIAYEPLWCS